MQSACAIFYCHVWPVPLYKIFDIISKRAWFSERKTTGHKVWVLIFSTTMSKIFLIIRIIQWDILMMYTGPHLKYAWFLSYFNEAWIFMTNFSKKAYIKFNENPSSRSRVVLCGQTDRHDETNGRISQFCERAFWVTCNAAWQVTT